MCVFDICSFSWIYSIIFNPSKSHVPEAEILAMPAMEEREKIESFWFKFQLPGSKLAMLWGWRAMEVQRFLTHPFLGIYTGFTGTSGKNEIPMTSQDHPVALRY